MDAIYKEHASKQGLDLCKEFKFQEIMDEYLSTAKVIPEMLNASNALRKHGKPPRLLEILTYWRRIFKYKLTAAYKP